MAGCKFRITGFSIHLYGGYPLDANKKLTYNEIVNSEIRRTDRRAAEPDHLLFALFVH